MDELVAWFIGAVMAAIVVVGAYQLAEHYLVPLVYEYHDYENK